MSYSVTLQIRVARVTHHQVKHNRTREGELMFLWCG